MSSPVDIPVVIIGGGGCGLNLSSFLSDLKVEHYLFERHPGTSLLPKAHYLSQRTLEIFRQHGLENAIRGQGCPSWNMSQIEWRTSLGGPESYDGRTIGAFATWGANPSHPSYETYRRDSPTICSNLPLIRLEPILRSIAEERNPGRVLFNHRVTDFEDQGNHVMVTVEGSDGKITQYRAQYVVAADGGKTAGPKIGVKMEGPTGLVDFVSTHFKADLSKYWDDRTFICHFINPEGGRMTNFDCGVLVQMGPTWGRHSQEWILHFGFDLNDTQRFDEAALVPRLRELLKLPDLDLEVLYTSHWVLERVLANKYSEGRIFVAGDAAHRRPPTAGLGLNTAIEDAHNIAWKLALVVHQKADPSLLNTYEVERRAIGKRNADWGLFSFKHFDVLNAAVGLRPGDRKYNIQHFTKLFDGSPLGNTQLAQIRAVLALQEIEFTAHGLELGYRYESDAVVPDGSDPPPTDPRGQVYYPTTRPGHRLPHAWLEKNGKVLSTHDLIGSGETDFVLLTDEHGDGWVQQAYLASKSTRLEIGTARIASRKIRDDPDLYEDREDRWIGLREVKDGGAILVRPDNFVAWRSRTPPVAGEAALLDALSQILGKSKGRGIYSDEAHGEEEHDFKNDKGYGFSNSVQSVTL